MAVLIQSGTTTANTVSTVTFSTYYPHVEIVNRGASELWFRVDGTDPTIAGDECDVIPAYSYKDTINNKNLSNTVISLLSTSAVSFTVLGAS